jgi:short-subunit dehydrogenase
MSRGIATRGATVLLTGATGGIGQAVARSLAANGASLVLTGRRTDVLSPLAKELGATSIAADLKDADDVLRLVAEAGPIDILIANAGLSASGAVLDFTVANLDSALDVNLRSPMVMARVLGEQMRDRGSGHIVFIGSIGGRISSAGGALYSATKFGLRGFSLGLREDLHGSGVGVSIVEPGFVRDAGMFADAGTPTPPGVRTSSPEDVARAVVRAIERNVGEIVVAPFEMRASSMLGVISPRLAARAQRLAGADKVAAKLSEVHRSKL